MMKNLVILMTIALTWGCVGHTDVTLTEQSDSSSRPFDPIREEAMIYRIVVAADENSAARTVVLVHTDAADHWTRTFLTRPDYVMYLHEPFHGFEAGAVDDFLVRNRDPGPQRNIAEIAPPAVPISDEMLASANASGPFMRGLDHKYPGSHGCFVLSRVGYSSTGDFALVYLAIGMRGDLIALRHTDSGWAITRRLNVWVS